ncbi:electron transporter [Pedobacter yonginense]|uniref:Electron transporter n=1 Tax=Pedobacter yonginense TaxID=651869 RepID=A0A317EQU6_9SPHI|nr:SCO family protein [Pedobacter yonginense]PWS27478.1 electron transporter [Pedobacter yonginense]
MKSFSISKTLILVSILAVPGFLFFYLLPHFAKNRYKSLPIYGEKKVASTFHSVKGKKIPDTIYHTVRDFKLINQNSDAVNWKSYENKIVVLNLFYTGSPIKDVAKSVNALVEEYQKNGLIKFISLSVDPTDRDKISSYARLIKAQAGKWDLLTGDTTSVYPFIRKDLMLDVIHSEETNGSKFIYSNQMILLDNQHRIRGYYEATNADAQAKLTDEIKVLVAEDLRNLKDGR